MQFRSSTPDLHNFYNSFLQKNRALNALSLLYCTPYTVHPTTENKKYFLCFFLYLPKGIYLCLFTIFPRPRAYLIHIRAKHKRRQASKQPSGYTREAYTPQALNSRQAIHAKPTRR